MSKIKYYHLFLKHLSLFNMPLVETFSYGITLTLPVQTYTYSLPYKINNSIKLIRLLSSISLDGKSDIFKLHYTTVSFL